MQSSINCPWFLYERNSICGRVLGAPSIAAAISKAKEGSVSSRSGCCSNRANSVMLSGYLKISDLKRVMYALAARGKFPWECSFNADW